METLKQSREVNVEMYRIQDAKFQNEGGKVLPFEGHIQVTGTAVAEIRKEVFLTGSVYNTTNQILEDPPGNNGSERAIRNVKVKQKISGQFKTERGAQVFASIRSVTDTCIKKGAKHLIFF